MSTRHRCPKCGHRDKSFSRYIDSETGEYLADNVGRCNREEKCGYHYKPKQYFENNRIFLPRGISNNTSQSSLPKPLPTSYIPIEVYHKSLSRYHANNFFTFLSGRFGKEIAQNLVAKYCIGTSKLWPGAAVFWQVDVENKVRTGKIMLYSPDTGKRVKEPIARISWAHKALKLQDFQLKQCPYGEHLLIDKAKPVGIVESEKTAIISSVYFPKFTWLACGSLSHLNHNLFTSLIGRNVVLFPDLGAYDKWTLKAEEFSHLANIQVSDLLEKRATDKELGDGLDLADYLLKFNHEEFLGIPNDSKNESEGFHPYNGANDSNKITTSDIVTYEASPIRAGFSPGTGENHSSAPAPHGVTELLNFFKTTQLPNSTIQLGKHGIISDVPQFVESHIAVVNRHSNNPTFGAFISRLELLRQILVKRDNGDESS